jgi:hypothetical protein
MMVAIYARPLDGGGFDHVSCEPGCARGRARFGLVDGFVGFIVFWRVVNGFSDIMVDIQGVNLVNHCEVEGEIVAIVEFLCMICSTVRIFFVSRCVGSTPLIKLWGDRFFQMAGE